MYEAPHANILSVLRNEASTQFGRCDILVALTKEQIECAKGVVGEDGYMILNIGYNAVRNYVADENGIGFDCRIKGVGYHFAFDYYQILGVKDSDVRFDSVDVTPVVPIFQFAVNIEKQHAYLTKLHESQFTNSNNVVPVTKENQTPRPNHLNVVK